MNLLPHWVLTDKFPAFYDSESKTALEQTARVYGAMQQLITEYNKFVDNVNQHIAVFENAAKKDYEIFTTSIRQEFQDFIDIIDLKIKSQDSIISNAANYMRTNLYESISTLLAEMRASGDFSREILNVFSDYQNQLSALTARMNTYTTMKEGSTSGDAELMDARIDYTGKTWENLGGHVRGLTGRLSDYIDILYPNSKYEWTLGRGISSSGVNEPLRYTAVSDLVPCVPGDKLYSYCATRDEDGFELNCRVSLYDENKQWISRHSIRDNPLYIPDTASYYCLTFGRGSDSGISLSDDDFKYFSVKHLSAGATLEYVNTQLGIIDNPRYRLAPNTDFDTITEAGRYSVRDNMSTMLNRPDTTTSGLLIVSRLHLKKRTIQFYINNSCAIFYRIKNTDTAWSRWRRIINNEESYSMANYTSDGVKILENVKKCLTPFSALSDVTDMFESGMNYEGVPYVATHYYSRDAFFNYSLETVFSMFNNPDSLMYTHNDETGKAYTGGVCSSFVSWITGQPIYYTTYDVLKMLNYKTINDLSDIEVGDVLITHTLFGNSSDHTAIVSNIYTDENGVSAIEVSEAWPPVFRTVKYTANNFWNLLEKYRVGRFDNQKIRTVPPLKVNTDIISERGDNTYYELGEPIFIKSANTTITVTSEDGTDRTVNLPTLIRKGSMYDVSDILNSVGRWTLHGINDEESHITVIKKGNAALANNILTLSGYEGCKPCGYAVVVIRNDGKDGGYDTHLDNPDYGASRLTIYSKDDPRYAGALNADTLSINVSDIRNLHVGYYVRVFYDTGCGQAYQDSNVVFFN